MAYFRLYLLLENMSKTSSDEDAGNATVGALLKKKINDDTTSELIVYSNNILWRFDKYKFNNR